jgi:N6-adenosine-specific RNA methylase IME4
MKFDLILADPPWKFKVWDHDTGSGRSAESHYPTMTITQLCALPIRDLTAENCALFLWCVWPSIFEFVPPLLEAWGFEYKTLAFEWWKLNKQWWRYFLPMTGLLRRHDFLERLFFMGMGYYTRANPEPCLLAVKGKIPVAVHNQRNFIIAPLREHSCKPDQQYTKIERLYPNRSYLELFARHTRPGWHSWGNEIEPATPILL